MLSLVFFFNDTATTEIYTYLHTLSLHDALPIYALLTLTTEIVSAHVMNNSVGINDLPGLIGSVHAALVGLGSPAEQAVELKPAVPVKSSIKPDYIVCLEDGVKLKMLKRHLMTHHGLTPDRKSTRLNSRHSCAPRMPSF